MLSVLSRVDGERPGHVIEAIFAFMAFHLKYGIIPDNAQCKRNITIGTYEGAESNRTACVSYIRRHYTYFIYMIRVSRADKA
jgi:hypothetical protein